MKKHAVPQHITTGLTAMLVCIVAGCATPDTVSSRFPKLQDNINAAREVDAETYAPAPLKSAEDKLASARSAVAAGDMVSAARLVDEAMADADYARVKAPTEKAKQDARALRDSIKALGDEINKMPVTE